MTICDKEIIEDDIIYTIVFGKEGDYKLLINHLNKTVKWINIDAKHNFKAIVKNDGLHLENELVDSRIHKVIMNDLDSY